MRRWMIGLVVAVLLAGAWAWRVREGAHEPTRAPVAGERAVDAAVAGATDAPTGDRMAVSRTPSVPTRAPATSDPLPAEGTPLAETYDALAARARAGDNAAAMRLAFDLTRCKDRAGADTDTLARLDAAEPKVDASAVARLDAASRQRFEGQMARAAALCRGVASGKVASRGEWLLLAAERGDAEAMVCFASVPDEFAPPLFGDAWFDWSRRWRERAPGFAELAFARGRVDILYMLADVYSGQTLGGAPISMFPLAGSIRADPARAVAIQDIAGRIGVGDPQLISAGYAALDDGERARARSLADRDVGKFKPPVDGRVSALACRRLHAQAWADAIRVGSK